MGVQIDQSRNQNVAVEAFPSSGAKTLLRICGGQDLYDEMYGRFGLKPFLCGNSGPQWAGWFRTEINSVDDLKGRRAAGRNGRAGYASNCTGDH